MLDYNLKNNFFTLVPVNPFSPPSSNNNTRFWKILLCIKVKVIMEADIEDNQYYLNWAEGEKEQKMKGLRKLCKKKNFFRNKINKKEFILRWKINKMKKKKNESEYLKTKNLLKMTIG